MNTKNNNENTTPNNTIPYAPEGTLDPATGLNIALDQVDTLLQLAVLGIENTPPQNPNHGERYIVGTGSGDWQGQDGRIACYTDEPGYWTYSDAYIALNRADNLLYIRSAEGWQVANRTKVLPEITGDTGTDLAGVVGQLLGALDGVWWEDQTS